MSKVISADVPDDLAERIEEAQEEGESRSAAVRRLLRTGLDAENSQHTPAIAWWFLTVGGFLFTAAYIDASPAALVGGAGVVLFVAGFALSRETVRHELAELRREAGGDGLSLFRD